MLCAAQSKDHRLAEPVLTSHRHARCCFCACALAPLPLTSTATADVRQLRHHQQHCVEVWQRRTHAMQHGCHILPQEPQLPAAAPGDKG